MKGILKQIYKKNKIIFSTLLFLTLVLTGSTAFAINFNLPLILNPTAVPEAYIGVSYSHTLTVSGGQAPYNWSAQGLPANCKLEDGADSSQKNLAGNFTSAEIGSHQFTINITDNNGKHLSQVYTLAVSNTAVPPIIITSTLNPGKQGQNYQAQLISTGGVPPREWSIKSGSLPNGIKLYEDGLIYGMPDESGSFSFIVQVTDAASRVSEKALTLTIAPTPVPQLEIAETDQLNAKVGIDFEYLFKASGGKPPYIWTCDSEKDLPSGLTILENGFLYGVPLQIGDYSFEVKATDKYGNNTERTVNLVVSNEPLRLLLEGEASWKIKILEEFGWSWPVNGGKPPYLFRIVEGALPTGLSLNEESGLISGIPTAPGRFEAILEVTDSTEMKVNKRLPLILEVVIPGKADFEAKVTSGKTPLTVNFTNKSTGPVTIWMWDFDEDGGIDSTEQNPVFTYTSPGTYTVSLTVQDANEYKNTKTITDYITVAGGENNVDNDNDHNNGNHSGSITSNPLTDPSYIFKDIQGHWAEDIVLGLATQRIISGYQDGTFRPDNEITRAEVLVLFMKALNLSSKNEKELTNTFNDSPEIPFWAREAVTSCFEEGIITGYLQEDGKLFIEAAKPVSRAEMAVMLSRIAEKKLGQITPATTNFTDVDNISIWARHGVGIAVTKKIVIGYPDNTFRPNNSITRAEAATMLDKLLNLIKN